MGVADLFDSLRPKSETISDGVTLLRGFADSGAVYELMQQVARHAPFRNQITPGGHIIKVATTNCGALGWTSGPGGYRYRPDDPETGLPWPAMPAQLANIATEAAEAGGFPGYHPNACLINLYAPGLKLSSHQDKNERDRRWPVVTVSIGVPATFQLFGDSRSGKPINILLQDGDVLVMGGASRMAYHGVKALAAGQHPLTGDKRYSLTFRVT
ncbi:MAG: alpha-ketoglutarate-dependent dioxygenase AlkB [Alphaproteobacteria bacterium]|nr:alpha-ketoglutarate-dependent dioxygenase AlkB [Alphaproteobacteria bacterium]